MGKMGSREGGKLGRLAREEVGSVFGTLDGLVTFPISKDREISTESEVRNNFDKAGWDAPQSTKYHFCECILRGFFFFLSFFFGRAPTDFPLSPPGQLLSMGTSQYSARNHPAFQFARWIWPLVLEGSSYLARMLTLKIYSSVSHLIIGSVAIAVSRHHSISGPSMYLTDPFLMTSSTVIQALVIASDKKGLSAFLPASGTRFKPSHPQISTTQPSPPHLPLSRTWQAADFSLDSVILPASDLSDGGPSVDGSVDLRLWSMKLLSRYSYVIG